MLRTSNQNVAQHTQTHAPSSRFPSMSGPVAHSYVTVDCLTVPRHAVPPPTRPESHGIALNYAGPTDLTDALLALNPANNATVTSSTSIRIKHNMSTVSAPMFRLSGKHCDGEGTSEPQLDRPAHLVGLQAVLGPGEGLHHLGSAVLQYNTPGMLPGAEGRSSAVWNAMPYPYLGTEGAMAPFPAWPRTTGSVFHAVGARLPYHTDGCASPRAASPDRESVEAAKLRNWPTLGQSSGARVAETDEAYRGAIADARASNVASAMYYASHFMHPMTAAPAGYVFAHPGTANPSTGGAAPFPSRPPPSWPVKQEVHGCAQPSPPVLRPQSALKRSREGHDDDGAASDPEATYRCNIPGCGAIFRRRYDLSVHSRVHTNERPFPCTMPGCTAAFKTAGACVAHVRTHTGERPFRCPYPNCHARFGQKSSCNRHVRLRHADWSGTYNGPSR